MIGVLADLRHTWTMARRQKGFASAALGTLALGVGATTAVFSLVYGVLLKPLPYPASDRLVQLSESRAGESGDPSLTNHTWHAWTRAESSALEAFVAYAPDEYTVEFPGDTVRVQTADISSGGLARLGATPAVGRLHARDAAPAPEVVLSHDIWRERFNADPAVVGRTLVIGGRAHVIVGVTRRGFFFPTRDVSLWTNLSVPSSAGEASTSRMSVLGWLRPGATIDQAAAEGTAIARNAAPPQSPSSFDALVGNRGPLTVHVRTMLEATAAPVSLALSVLLAAVILLLCVAAVNVANLFLLRGLARQRELAIRLAIGATGARIRRQLLTETCAFAVAGCMLGLLLAWTLIAMMRAFAPADFPRMDDVRLDGAIVTFAIVLSAVSALVSGLLPAMRGLRNPGGSLSGRSDVTAFMADRGAWLSDVLVGVQAAVAVVLVAGALLLSRTFIALMQVDNGYAPDQVMTARIHVAPGPGTAERNRQLTDTLLTRLRATPGVVAAGVGNMMPFADSSYRSAFELPSSLPGQPIVAHALEYAVTPGHAEALGLRLRAGRLLAPSDMTSAVVAVVVNREFACLHLSGAAVVGRRFPGGFGSSDRPAEIVGLVDDVRGQGPASTPQPEIYLPLTHGGPLRREIYLVMRSDTPSPTVSSLLRGIVRDIDSGAAVAAVTPLRRLLASSVDAPRFAMSVVSAFAMVAMALAAIGLYGTLSYSVSRRRREIGVRAALGAGPARIVKGIVRQGLMPILAGAAIGVLSAAALAELLRGLLFHVSPRDPIALIAAPVALIAVAAAVCLVPARRAARTDPAEALRAE